MTRAIYRGYWQGGRRSARVTRLHIIREEGKRHPWLETWCGQSAQQHQNSEPVIFDPMPDQAPDGLRWCPQCIGHLAELYGLLGEVAGRLAAYDPGRAASG